ncbi:PIG-L deacetylase family protein [Stratiformator vulcanicus]|uniref:Glucosamine-6-phosphate deaminase-like protein n=1 Tax=Stratiformator vulcanicus TaxID=2527980 RepID=A0A517R2T4_9PLAN|nr:PIG-L deacetylase family protein [Stratiformator vulcanicus]QDT38200.1 glucosamine-6-phosphate deaminase-like protein [Stratiformator vulcanicus]
MSIGQWVTLRVSQRTFDRVLQHNSGNLMKKFLLTAFLATGINIVASLVSLAADAGVETAAESGLASLDILVIAPHPDDEVIGCGGVIIKADEAGRRVGIVVVTSGDGYPNWTAKIFEKDRENLKPADFKKVGTMRRQAAVDAATNLGVLKEDVMLLGYPDSKLAEVYQAADAEPVRQPYTEQSETYGKVIPDYHSATHGTPAPYVKSSVIGDLAEIIKTRKPREIYVTNTADTHKDHSTTGQFSMDAAKAANYGGPIYTYIVHGEVEPNLPQHRVALSPKQVARKRAAIIRYDSQLPNVTDHLDIYAARATEEEVFWIVESD